MDSQVVAEFDQVSKVYPSGLLKRGGLPAVTEVSFDIRAGEVFALLGPNRAGKTTLVKILLTLCRATSGRVTRLGRPVSDRSTLAQIGYVHENQAFPRYWNAENLLHYYGALAFIPESEVRKRVPPLLERVGLADRSQEPIARFSKGMIQRLGLAQALLGDPDLLVLDEPTEGLDMEGRRVVREVIRERCRLGQSVLLISHALQEVEQLSDRAAVLNNGRLAYLGPVAPLCRDLATGTPRPLAEALEKLYERSPQ